MINNDNGYKFNPGTIVTHGTSMGLWLPALDVNRIKAGINGIAGIPMVGINGHLGLLVAMMMIGGRRDHNGTVNQRSISTKVRLQNGTVIILRKPGATASVLLELDRPEEPPRVSSTILWGDGSKSVSSPSGPTRTKSTHDGWQ